MSQEDPIKGADGAFYVQNADGDYVRVVEMQVDPAQGQQPLVQMASPEDLAKYSEQWEKGSHSHVDFFKKKYANSRQKMKRAEVMQKELQKLTQRADPSGIPQVRRVKDEKFEELSKMFMKAQKAGEAQHCPFQPLATYAHKIVKVRPILKGEIGVYGGDILCLEDGYGVGNTVAVSEDLDAQELQNRRGESTELGGSEGSDDEV